MNDRIDEIRTEAEAAIAAAPDSAALEHTRIRYLGRKAELPNLLRGVAELPPEQRGAVGKAANQARQTLDRLIEAADPAGRPVVGGLCFTENPGGPPLPTLYELTRDGDGQPAFARHETWPDDGLVRVTATGAACLLIHRDALEAVGKQAGDGAAPWFREWVVGSSLIGEDLTFCLRCGVAGIPVHVHTGVRAGHMKTTMI